jgi:iron complex transport system substrate-binding protein
MLIRTNKKRIITFLGVFLLGILILLGCQQEPTSGEDNQDTNQSEGTSDALPFERIVVDSPSIAHYMSLYNVPLVGIPTTTKPMPEEYEGLTDIGIAVQPNIETIVSLDPDLYVGDKVLEQFSKDQVESYGINTVYIDNSSYEAVFDSVLEIGELLGFKDIGETFVSEQRAQESVILEQAEELAGKKVALIMGTAEAYQLATPNSYLGSILEKIGVENIAEEVGETSQEYVTYSKESLVASNPDYILALAHGGEPEQVEQSFKDEFSSSFWDDTTAKRQEQIYYIDSNQFPVTGSIDNVDVLERVVRLLERGSIDDGGQ